MATSARLATKATLEDQATLVARTEPELPEDCAAAMARREAKGANSAAMARREARGAHSVAAPRREERAVGEALAALRGAAWPVALEIQAAAAAATAATAVSAVRWVAESRQVREFGPRLYR